MLIILISLLLSSCATDVANRYYATERYASRPVAEVELLTSEPTEPYIVVADFQMRGESANGMRKRAADIGADAVIVTILGGYYSGTEEWAGKDYYKGKIENNKIVGTYTRIVGTAIKYQKD
ncbi:hypothetical protein [Desulfocastanea catecholica]